MNTKVTPPIETWLQRVITAVNAGQVAHAWDLCTEAAAAHPPHPALLQLQAVLALQRGDGAVAADLAEASLALRGDHLPTLKIAADAARAAKAPARALKWLDRAVALAPQNADAWFDLSLVRQDVGDLDGAAAALREVLRIAPARAEAEVNLGIVLQEAGRVDEAMRAYGRAFRLREDTFGRIAHALSTPPAGRLWLALDDLKGVLRRLPD